MTGVSSPTVLSVRRVEEPSWNERALGALMEYEPNYSECVRVAKRPLSFVPWVAGFSEAQGSWLDRNNLELSHEQLIWEVSGTNIGFGSSGLFSEQIKSYSYRYGDTCYDGSKMRKALQALAALKPYHFLLNNCQDFIEQALKLYRQYSFSSREARP